MAQYIVMPKLGLTMKKGKIFKWLKKEGDPVAKGDKLFTVETDKLTNDIEATADGVLLKIIHQDGSVDVLKPVGILGAAGEDISALLAEAGGGAAPAPTPEAKPAAASQTSAKPQAGGRVKATPKARKLAAEKGIELMDIAGTGAGGAVTEDDVLKHAEQATVVKSSPTAAAVARDLGVDMGAIGKPGRVMKDDVLNYWNFSRLEEMAAPEETRVGMSAMRQVIAERMSASQTVAATVNYTLSVDVRELKRLKDKLKAEVKVTYTDLIVKALSRVLLEHPLLNCSIDGDEIITRNYTNIGVAVALDDGLIVPVVKYANIKGLEAVSREIRELAGKARGNRLESEDLTGGTFTVTNLGMFRMEAFTPIINQPEVAILGINTIKDVATNVDGQLVFVPMMTLSLTADHRVVDGAVAAQFLNRLKDVLENPSVLML